MTLADWALTAVVLVALGVVGALAVDRNRLKRRLGHTEGVITGLTLDLDAMRARVGELQSYLNLPASWDVGAAAPADLAEARKPDRWSPRPAAPAFPRPSSDIDVRAEATDEVSSRAQPSREPRG